MTTKRTAVVGGLLFAGLTVVTVPRHVRSIETDIARRSETVLARHDLAARVRVDGRDVVLSGWLSSDEARDRAAALVADLRGVRSVSDQLSAPPSGAAAVAVDGGTAAPAGIPVAVPPAARVRAELTADGRLDVDGQAPSADAVHRWLTAAREIFPDGEVRDRLEVVSMTASGQGGKGDAEATALDAALVAGLTALRQLDWGRLSATPSRLRLSGETGDASLETRLAADLATALPSLRIAIDVHTRGAQAASGNGSPRLTVARGRDGSVVIGGFAPDESTKRAWIEKAAASSPDWPVQDRLRVAPNPSVPRLEASGAPLALAECMLAAVPWVDELLGGRFDIGPARVRVFGKAPSATAVDRMRAELEAAGCEVDTVRLQVGNEES